MLRIPDRVLFSADKLPDKQRVLASYQPGLQWDGQVLLKCLHPDPALCLVTLAAGKVLEASLPLFPFHVIALTSLTKAS